ncbi:MAG: hypothetical protein HYV40_01545 [Candidatus Levybacteria bacterium]|nr:hypothetical protein [Candidatus Levybacteria bacterium]
MNKKVLIIISVVVVLALGIGGFVYTRNANQTLIEETDEGILDEVIPTLAPSDIGLEMVARADGRAVKLTLNNALDIQKIEFDLVYDADQSGSFDEGEGEGKVTRNVTDELDVDGQSPFETKYYDLGSCSSGKCRYDTGVTQVKVVMKVTKTDGKVFQVEDSLDL